MLRQKPALVLIFDIDGTLVDTDTHLSECVADQFTVYGVAFQPKEYFEEKTFLLTRKNGAQTMETTRLFGATWEDVYCYLHSLRPAIDPGEQGFKRDITQRLMHDRHAVIVRPAVVDAAKELRGWCAEQGILFAIGAATNGTRGEAYANLALVKDAGLDMDAVITADDVTQRKPHPDPYLQCHAQLMEKLLAQGHQPYGNVRAFAFEDSSVGATSALTANAFIDLTCVYVPVPQRFMTINVPPNVMPQRFVPVPDAALLASSIKTLYDMPSSPARAVALTADLG